LRGLTGLGLPAYETQSGTAVFLKDSKLLRVDATKLKLNPRANAGSRTDIAYEVATDVMGCWSES
jgi:hypothetical protein